MTQQAKAIVNEKIEDKNKRCDRTFTKLVTFYLQLPHPAAEANRSYWRLCELKLHKNAKHRGPPNKPMNDHYIFDGVAIRQLTAILEPSIVRGDCK